MCINMCISRKYNDTTVTIAKDALLLSLGCNFASTVIHFFCKTKNLRMSICCTEIVSHQDSIAKISFEKVEYTMIAVLMTIIDFNLRIRQTLELNFLHRLYASQYASFRRPMLIETPKYFSSSAASIFCEPSTSYFLLFKTNCLFLPNLTQGYY